MLQSMTGYGQAQDSRFTISIKTLNHKYLEPKIYGLEEHPSLELKAQELLSASFKRGRVEVRIRSQSAEKPALTLNREAARAYTEMLQQLITELNLTNPGVSLEALLRLEGIFQKAEESEETLWEQIEPVLKAAIAQCQESRQREGALLTQELRRLLTLMSQEIDKIERQAGTLKTVYRERLHERLRELLQNSVALDEGRLELEVALLAERADISEEIARLRMHLHAAEAALQNSESVGLRLDFLSQELAREANTIASKAKDGLIAQAVIELKALIEKFREQARNVE
ncbi:MAG: YicC family protein [Candidatus Bipolaricaulota bacterium]|nr:YicC family protein [Candidatus Bipolaricaulota bacterium]MCS7274249.1 YicC family protein [Candidatus Bipolaricaulota bacterium]MDW8110641.1 YicC/YloC family endoribonuclease [Candidatus Bipolaricaulota bacterium]MDW8328501.1 YicC/YloC family endoribonuclease [Candidatus Bipolaricaulota bacterium]